MYEMGGGSLGRLGYIYCEQNSVLSIAEEEIRSLLSYSLHLRLHSACSTLFLHDWLRRTYLLVEQSSFLTCVLVTLAFLLSPQTVPYRHAPPTKRLHSCFRIIQRICAKFYAGSISIKGGCPRKGRYRHSRKDTFKP